MPIIDTIAHSAAKTLHPPSNWLQVNLLDVIFLRNDEYYCYMKLVAFFKGYNVVNVLGILNYFLLGFVAALFDIVHDVEAILHIP